MDSSGHKALDRTEVIKKALDREVYEEWLLVTEEEFRILNLEQEMPAYWDLIRALDT